PHGANHREFVDDGGEMRQQFAQPLTRLAMLREFVPPSHHQRNALDERESLTLEELVRAGLAVVFRQFGLVIEQFELRRRARHMEIDDGARLGRKVRLLRRERICPRLGAPAFERREKHARQTNGAALQEIPPGSSLNSRCFRGHKGYLRVTTSSRFKIALATTT